MKDFQTLLSPIFPEESFLKGLNKKQNKRAFSIKPEKGEKAFGIDLEKIKTWPENKKCEALFICRVPDKDQFLIVLVELKGEDRRKALKQIQESRHVLCKETDSFLKNIHAPELRHALQSNGIIGHGKRLLGIIIARKSQTLKARERSALMKKFGIVMIFKTGGMTEISCRELWRYADGKRN